MNFLFIIVNNWKQSEEFTLLNVGFVYKDPKAITAHFGIMGIIFRLTVILTV